MLALDRHRWLLDELNERGSLRTSEVAERVGVAEETIRRDFEKLEGEGMLRRTHGGAVRLETDRREFPAGERALQHAAEKQAIARAAARSAGLSTYSGASSITAAQIWRPISSARSCSSFSRRSSGDGGAAQKRSSAARR